MSKIKLAPGDLALREVLKTLTREEVEAYAFFSGALVAELPQEMIDDVAQFIPLGMRKEAYAISSKVARLVNKRMTEAN